MLSTSSMPKKQHSRKEGYADELFDSFSESAEGSTHSTRVKSCVAQDVQGNLYELLSSAANAFRDQASCTSQVVEGQLTDNKRDRKNYLTELEPSKGNNSIQAVLEKSTGDRVSSREAAEQAVHFGANCEAIEERLPEGHSPDRKELSTEQPTAVCNQSSNGREDVQGVHRDRRKLLEHNQSLAAQTMKLPSDMVQEQGMWTRASASSSVSRVSSALSGMRRSGSILTEDQHVPQEVFYSWNSSGGRKPSPRWAHAAAAVHDKLYIFGGAGHGYHSDCHVYHSGKNEWSQLGRSRERPPATYGAAAAVSHGRIFLFGGKQSQKHCRRLYSLDPATEEWRTHKESAAAPPAVASHSMTAVGSRGIYVFGGEGRKLSNSVFALDPETFQWARISTLGAVPVARQGHTAVWDGADSLVVFGGAAGERNFGDVHVLSLSTGFWSEAECQGALPPARHSHSAALMAANLMLLWGGCGDRGAIFNDAYLLNITTFRWHKLRSVGSPPSGRYCHSCSMVGGQPLLFGGTDACQPLDSLVTVSTALGHQLGSLADSLSNLTNGVDETSEMVRLQLGNHLRQRHAQETSQVAVARAEIAEKLFEQQRQRSSQLAIELQEVKLLLTEEESLRRQEAAERQQDGRLHLRALTLEKHRNAELTAQLKAALATIQKQAGAAAVVDGYKAMYDRLVEERGALVERNVTLEFQCNLFESQIAGLTAAAPKKLAVRDAWESELDERLKDRK